MWTVEKSFEIKLGSNTFVNIENLIDYRGTPLFTVRRRDRDGLLGVDCDIYDANRVKVATMRRGNIVDGDRNAYDISLNPHHYQIREKSTGRVICDFRRQEAARGAEIELNIDLYTPSGFHFVASPEGTNIPDSITLSHSRLSNARIGISVS